MIISGHIRVEGAKKLGWTHITAWVRDELGGDDDAINRRHIEANLDRRQLGRLDRGRLALRPMESERGRRDATWTDGGRDGAGGGKQTGRTGTGTRRAKKWASSWDFRVDRSIGSSTSSRPRWRSSRPTIDARSRSSWPRGWPGWAGASSSRSPRRSRRVATRR